MTTPPPDSGPYPPGPATPTLAAPGPGTPRVPKHLTFRAVKAYLGRHPILCLALLSPGIPEYLSSSSALSTLLGHPPFGMLLFFLQLAANLGLYVPGVLLVREAMVRWKKGWGTVLLLGAAYGILEEGIALETLFYSRAGPVLNEGYYGHWLGVNWVWTAGILFVHMILSIALPILLLSLALPHTRGRSLVGRSGTRWAFVVWAIDIPALMIVVHAIYQYWMGWPIFFASFGAIGLLVLLAYRAPANLLPTRIGPPRITPFGAGVLGLGFYLPMLLIESLFLAGNIAPAVTIFVLVAYELALGYVALRTLGTVRNERQLVAFAAGVLVVIGAFGFLAELPVPVTVVADGAAFWFLRHLWRKYAPSSVPWARPVPPGALASG